jgi:hypothetical protein
MTQTKTEQCQTSNTPKNSSESPKTTNEPVIVQGACAGVANIWRAKTEDLGNEPNER